MATSKCVNCKNETFETKIVSLPDSNVKMEFIQCSKCGGVIGVNEYYTAYIVAKRLAIALGKEKEFDKEFSTFKDANL